MFIPTWGIAIAVIVIALGLIGAISDSSTIDYLNNRIEDLETQLYATKNI